MTYLILAIWADAVVFPKTVLSMTYQPPLRPVRKAPPSIRMAGLGPLEADELAKQMATVFASLPIPRDDR